MEALRDYTDLESVFPKLYLHMGRGQQDLRHLFVASFRTKRELASTAAAVSLFLHHTPRPCCGVEVTRHKEVPAIPLRAIQCMYQYFHTLFFPLWVSLVATWASLRCDDNFVAEVFASSRGRPRRKERGRARTTSYPACESQALSGLSTGSVSGSSELPRTTSLGTRGSWALVR